MVKLVTLALRMLKNATDSTAATNIAVIIISLKRTTDTVALLLLNTISTYNMQTMGHH
jgi:hypothetical protein